MTTPTWPGGGAPASIVRAFKEAWEARNIDALIGLLDPDATAIADTGGLASALPSPIEGSEEIVRACLNLARIAPDLTILERTSTASPAWWPGKAASS